MGFISFGPTLFDEARGKGEHEWGVEDLVAFFELFRCDVGGTGSYQIFREATPRDDGQHSVKGMKRGMEEAGARDGECEKVTTSLFHTVP